MTTTTMMTRLGFSRTGQGDTKKFINEEQMSLQNYSSFPT
jgi:hypothetical protein